MQWLGYSYLLSYKYCNLQFYDQNIYLVKVLIPHNTDYNMHVFPCAVLSSLEVMYERGGEREIHAEFWCETNKETYYLEDIGVDGRIILK